MPLRAGQEWKSPDGRTVARVLEASPSRGVFERELPLGTGRTDAHVHRDFRQRFEVVSGSVELAVDGAERSAAPGESVDVPPGTGHVDPYNAGSEPAVWRNVVEPLTPFAEVYVASYGEMLAGGVLNDQQEFTTLQLMTVLSAGRGQSFAVGPPVPLQRLVIPLLGAIGRARGISTQHSETSAHRASPITNRLMRIRFAPSDP